MTEEDALKLIAAAIRGTERPEIDSVATFGGGDSGLPGVRVEHADGPKFFLVPDLTGGGRPVETETDATPAPPLEGRPGFLDFVSAALYAAGHDEISRVDTMFAAVDDPTGIRVTTTDGDVHLFRVLCSPEKPAPPPDLPVLPGLGRVAREDGATEGLPDRNQVVPPPTPGTGDRGVPPVAPPGVIRAAFPRRRIGG